MVRGILAALCAGSLLAAAEPGDALRQAVAAYREGRDDPARYRAAAALFARAAESETLTAEQREAWAYCRLRVLAEDWNAARGDAAAAKRVAGEAAEAMRLAAGHAGVQRFGRELILAAGGTPPVIEQEPAGIEQAGWFSLESGNFRVRFPASARTMAESLSSEAESQRQKIFERWSGPASGDWSAKCEIVVHASAADFAHATSQPPEATGHALVQIDGSRVSLRRIDLRADDDLAKLDALPRELTHVILADLFPASPPPRWAADGMAVLAMSGGTVERYLATAGRLAERGELPSAASLMQNKGDEPLSAVSTVAAAALVEMLVRSKGERSFTLFLRDSQRYGLEKSLERQFGFVNTSDLDAALLRSLKQ